MLEIYLLSLLFRYIFKLHVLVQYMSLKIYTLFIMKFQQFQYLRGSVHITIFSYSIEYYFRNIYALR